MANYNDLEQKLHEIDVKQITLDASRKAAMRQRMAAIVVEQAPVKRPRQTTEPRSPLLSFLALPTAFVSMFVLVGVLAFVLNNEGIIRDISDVSDKENEQETYTPDTNLLSNPDFSYGEVDWWDEKMGRVLYGEMCMSIPHDVDVHWDALLKQEEIPYRKGKTYVLSFDGYVTNRESVPLLFSTEISSDPYPNLFREQFTLTSEKERHEFTFTSLIDSIDWPRQGGVVIQMGGQGAVEACFDNFEVIELEGIDETIVTEGENPPRFKDVTAGDFPMGTGKYWDTYGMGEIAPPGEMCVHAPDELEYMWEAHLAHLNLLFVQGRTYRLTFDSYATREDMQLRIVAGLASEPYTLFREQTKQLDTTKQTYTFEFEALFDTYNLPQGGNVSMQMGGQGEVTVCFDNVSVVEVES